MIQILPTYYLIYIVSRDLIGTRIGIPDFNSALILSEVINPLCPHYCNPPINALCKIIIIICIEMNIRILWMSPYTKTVLIHSYSTSKEMTSIQETERSSLSFLFIVNTWDLPHTSVKINLNCIQLESNLAWITVNDEVEFSGGCQRE